MNGKKTWIAAVILCGVMLIGIGIGSVGTLLIIRSTFRHPRPNFDNVELRKEPVMDFMLQRLVHSLNLTDAQTQEIKGELTSMSASFRALHESTRSELTALVNRVDEAIKTHLNPDQIKIFEEQFVKNRFRNGPPDGKDWRRPDGPPMMDGGFGPMPPPGDMGPPRDGDKGRPPRDRENRPNDRDNRKDPPSQ